MLFTPAGAPSCHFFFFFNDTATTEIYTLSLHDALPICARPAAPDWASPSRATSCSATTVDRKSTRLNSSHQKNSYAVFCLKKKTQAPGVRGLQGRLLGADDAPAGRRPG